MKRSAELRQDRTQLMASAEQMLDNAERERRDFTNQEQSDFNNMMRKAELLASKIKQAELDEADELATFEGRSVNRSGQPRVARDTQTVCPQYAVTRDGATIRLLTPSESLRSVTPNTLPDGARPEDFSFGRALRGIVTGSWRNAELEHRALSSGSGVGGGYLVEPILSSQVIDFARNESVCFRAGALTLPMETAEVHIARLTSDPSATWRGESTTLSEDTAMQFGQFKLGAKTLAALIAAPVELIEDAANLDGIVRNSLGSALGLALDRAILRGNGGLEITGLRNWYPDPPAIQYIDMGAGAGGALTDYSKFSEGVQKVLEANGVPNAAVFAPRTWGVLDRFVETTTGQPLNPPESFRGLTKFVTNQIPTDLTHGTAQDASEVYIGDFSKLLVGMRTELTIEVSREAGDAFKKLQVYIRAYLRADALPTQPTHFVLIDGIVPAGA